MTMIVTGTAQSQKIHCCLSMFRMSTVFIPKTDETKDIGRKTTVTVVKTSIAASLRSLLDSMRSIF